MQTMGAFLDWEVFVENVLGRPSLGRVRNGAAYDYKHNQPEIKERYEFKKSTDAEAQQGYVLKTMVSCRLWAISCNLLFRRATNLLQTRFRKEQKDDRNKIDCWVLQEKARAEQRAFSSIATGTSTSTYSYDRRHGTH